jgi:hypothetical protein
MGTVTYCDFGHNGRMFDLAEGDQFHPAEWVARTTYKSGQVVTTRFMYDACTDHLTHAMEAAVQAAIKNPGDQETGTFHQVVVDGLVAVGGADTRGPG